MGKVVVFTVGVTLLTCALAFSSADTENLKIFQVTDERIRREEFNGDWLLGVEKSFKVFMKTYKKEYKTRDEYLHRLLIFAKNTVRAAENQALDPSAVHGVTPFLDLSEEEFERGFMGLTSGVDRDNDIFPTAPLMEVDGLPENFDWREKGAVTEVKMQGVCGSCWAFSTTGSIEGANFIATRKLLSFSEQQLLDCDHTCDPADKATCNNGCHGGLMTNAYKYLMETGGLEEEKAYPYTAKHGSCKFESEKVAVRVANFTNIPLDDEQIAANLVHRGPLAVGLNAAFMQTYIKGVSCPLICPKQWVNHGVLLVGYGAKGFSVLRLGYRPYWIIKNSWGKEWGEDGYYRLCRGRNICGVDSMVSAVTVTT